MKHLVMIILLLSSLITFCNDDFNTIYNNTLKFEGSRYVKNNIEESKYGISKHYTSDVKNLTKDNARKIAYKKIYKAHRLDEINDMQLRTFIFDWLYHSAPTPAIKNIQKVLVKKGFEIEIDGIIGSSTIKALNKCNKKLIIDLKESRLTYLRSLKHYKKYKNNWENRIAKII